MDTLFTGDPHLAHKRCCFEFRAKHNFPSIEYMNDFILDRWNSQLKPGDRLIIGGDFAMCKFSQIEAFRRRIACNDVWLSWGNHDFKNAGKTHKKRKEFKQLFTKVKSVFWLPKIKGHDFFISHYSHRVWPKSHYGSIHLYAHSHGNLPNYWTCPCGHVLSFGRCMDCGCDTNDFYLYRDQEIIDRMIKIPIEFPDHHKPKETT